MTSHRKRNSAPRAGRVLAMALATCTIGSAAIAQENQNSAPVALQFPNEARSNASGNVSIATVRTVVESTVDVILCKTLMRMDNRPIPEPFTMQNCEQTYAQRVASNTGPIHWASGARPRQCGQDCFGRPSMTQQDHRMQPNLRRAHLFAWVNLRTTGTLTAGDRDVSLPLDIFFTCEVENGARNGDLVIEARVGPPAIGDPGVFESIGSFFTAGYLSSYIESEIRRQLPAVSAQREDAGNCRSVGVALGADSADDAVTFDLPASGGRVVSAAVTSALRQQARIELLRIVRHPLPPLVAQEHGRPGDPISGQFSVFLNGATHFIPPQDLTLPVTGGSAAINFCTTVDLAGWDRLQILFANDLGGAAWSQFPESGGFGQGGVRTLTTGRTIVVPGRGLPDPQTGRPGPARPQTVVLREFELTYRITYSAAPAFAVANPPSAVGGVRSELAGQITGVRATTATTATAPSTPCREI